jgi:hypothetical protein
MDIDAGRDGRTHQRIARVRQERRAGIAHQSHDLARLELAQKTGDTLLFVVLVQRDQFPRDTDRCQQRSGSPRIFRRDQIRALQCRARARREIAEIADRGRDYLESAGRRELLRRNHYNCFSGLPPRACRHRT